LGSGFWVWGFGGWGLGPGPTPKPQIPNPQSPIPKLYHLMIFIKKILFKLKQLNKKNESNIQ